MLDGRYASVTLAKYRTTLGINHILSYSIDHRLTFDVDALDLVARILRGRVECYSQVQTSMQSFSKQ